MVNRVSWKTLAKVSVGCAGALGILFFLLFCWAAYGPDKHELTKHAHTEWSREFRKIGLYEVPEHAKYAGGAWAGHWNFRADIPEVRQWLSRSRSLETAKVMTRPGKKAYLFYVPAAHRVCLVVVSFAPKRNPPVSDPEARVEVDTIDIGTKYSSSTERTRAVKDALETLASMCENTARWSVD
jgi:hypothetical protein